MATQEILNGESFTSSGVEYTAIDGDAKLKVNDSGIVEGIESGVVEAKIDGAETTPVITIDGTTAFDFVATGSEAEGLSITANEKSNTYLSGNVEYSAAGVTFPEGEIQFKVTTTPKLEALFGTITADIPAGGIQHPFDSTAGIAVDWADESTLTFDGVMKGTMALGGKIAYDGEETKVLFAEGSKLAVKDFTLNAENPEAPVMNFSLTALTDSEMDVLGKSVGIIDGSSFQIEGELLGFEGTVAVNGGNVIVPFGSDAEKEIAFTSGATVTIDDSGEKPAVTFGVEESAVVKLEADKEAKTLTLSTEAESGINISSAANPALSRNIKGGSITVSREEGTTTLNEGAVVTSTITDTESGETLRQVELTINKGAMTTGGADHKIKLEENSEIIINSLTDKNTFMKVSNTDALSASIVFDDNGITLTPDEDGRSFDVEISNGENSTKLGFEFRSGSVSFGRDNTIGLGENSEVEFTLPDGKTLVLDTKDSAGGKLEPFEGGIKFTPNEDDGGFRVKFADSEYAGVAFFCNSGSFAIKNGEVTLADGTELHTVLLGKDAESKDDDVIISVKANGIVKDALAIEDDGIHLQAAEDEGKLEITVSKGEESNTLGVDLVKGGVVIGKEGAIGLEADSEFEVTLPDGRALVFDTKDTAGGTLSFSEEEGLKFTPNADDGGFRVKFADSEAEGVVFLCSGGSFALNKDNEVTIADGTKWRTILLGKDVDDKTDDIVIEVEAKGEVGGKFALTEDEAIKFTPKEGEGSFDVTISDEKYGSTVNLELKSGAIAVNKENEISVDADTEMVVKFTDDYSIALKAAQEAGGKVGFNEKGIQFIPNEGDGKLEITVTDGETVRTAKVELTGAVTFALDGTISLDKDAVANFEFEDGAGLKIISNDDSSTQIKITAENGVSITPKDVESVTLELTTPGGLKTSFEEIDGIISYDGGIVTLADGTELKEVISAPPEDAPEPPEGTPKPPEDVPEHYIKSVGGTSTIDFTEDKKVIFTPGEGATLTTIGAIELTAGSLIFIDEKPESKDTEMGILTAGTVATQIGGRPENFILETAGEYTLNGIPITTTADGVEVTLVGKDDHAAVEFDVDAAVEIPEHEISGDEGTKVIISNEGQDVGLIMYEAGTASFDGKEIELTEDVERGIRYLPTEEGFVVSGRVGNEESNIRRAAEEVSISGSENYKVTLGKYGIEEISNVDGGSSVKAILSLFDKDGNDINEGRGSIFDVVTKSNGAVKFGENDYKVDDEDGSAKMTVNFDSEGNGVVTSVENLNGSFEGKIPEEVEFNGTEIKVSDGSEDVTALADGERVLVKGIENGKEVTFEADKTGIVVGDGESLKVNGITYSPTDDKNGVIVDSEGVFGLDPDAQLTIDPAGTYKVNGKELEVGEGKKVVGTSDGSAEIFKEISPYSSSEEILEQLGIDEDKVTDVEEAETKLPNSSGSSAVVPADAEGETKVKMGDKGGAVVVEETSEETPVSVIGGKGKDTLVSKGNDVTFDMAAGGKDQVTALGGKITMDNYNPDTKAGIKLTNEQLEKGVVLDTGKVVLEGAEVDLVVGTDVDNFVNLYTPDDKEMRVGFATEGNNVVDASKSKNNMVLLGGGEYNGMSLANEIEDVSLLGGSGNDSLFAGEGSYIDPGAGKNYVKMSDEGGSTVNYTEGKTTLDNFNFVGDEDGEPDTINTGKVGIDGVKVSDGDVVLKTKKGNITINDAEDKTIAIENDATDGVVNMTVAKDEVKIVENGYYVAAGKNAKASLEDYTGDTANVNLSNHDFTQKDAITFYGDIKEVDASGYKNEATLVGDDNNNVLKAGDGGTLLDGGKGNNTLVGADGAVDTFVVGKGNDVIKNFAADVDEDSDKISLTGGLDTVAVRGNDVVLTVGDSKTTVEGLKNQTFQLANEATNNETIAMQISDKELNVEGNGYYVASSNDAKVSLKDYAGGSVNANLADSDYNNGGLSFYGDIKTLDATGYEGNASLAGNAGSNNIIAGEGNSTLWGGHGGDDTLFGGDGSDLFIYGKGNGNDVVQNANEQDTVKLVNIALEDIMVRDENIFSGNDVIFRISDGGTLTVKDGKTNGATYDVAGVQYVVNDGKFETK